MFHTPFSTISFIIIILIANHMIVIRALKNRLPDFFCYQHFNRTDDRGNFVRRGRCPHRPAVDPYHHMNMIGHDYIFFYFFHILNVFLNDCSISSRDDVGIVPYKINLYLPKIVLYATAAADGSILHLIFHKLTESIKRLINSMVLANATGSFGI